MANYDHNIGYRSPEHVGFWPRVWASTIDSLVLFALFAVVGVIAAMMTTVFTVPESGEVPVSVAWGLIGVLVAISWSYYALCWQLWGATLGKRMLGQRVVDATTYEEIRP